MHVLLVRRGYPARSKSVFDVTTSGEVKDQRVISGHPLLLQPALGSLRGWKFAPLRNGPIQAVVDFEFALRDESQEPSQEEVFLDTSGQGRVVISPPFVYPTETQIAAN